MGAADYSVFVGDLAPEVTDYALQENFRHFFASVRSAKVLSHSNLSVTLSLCAVRVTWHWSQVHIPYRAQTSVITCAVQAGGLSQTTLLLTRAQNIICMFTDIAEMGLPSVQVITDPLTGRSKGYGFVRFGNEGERDRSLTDMSGHIINSRPIRVSVATAKKSQSSAAVRESLIVK